VHTVQQQRMATRIAAQTEGVRRVVNELEIAAGMLLCVRRLPI